MTLERRDKMPRVEESIDEIIQAGAKQGQTIIPGLSRIAGIENIPCRHPDHAPPVHLIKLPGVYAYRCPGCRLSAYFSVVPSEGEDG
jgi:hypothetical protein